MKCPRCGSSDVTVQAVVEHHLVDADRKRHGFLWRMTIGLMMWPLRLFRWVLMIPVRIIRWVFRIQRPKDISNETRAKAVCQTCGHVWEP